MQETDHQYEAFEKQLTKFQTEFSPSTEFAERMKKRLERHHILMQESGRGSGNDVRVSFWAKLGTRTYAVVTAFVFVIFTGGISAFAYSNDSVTNGNPLYPIKRGLEAVESAFSNQSAQSTAEFQVKLIQRRLGESRFLTLQGVVDETTAQEVSTAVDQGIVAIQSMPAAQNRDSLLLRVTGLLQDEQKKYYDIAGVKPSSPTMTMPSMTLPTEETTASSAVSTGADNRTSASMSVEVRVQSAASAKKSQNDRKSTRAAKNMDAEIVPPVLLPDTTTPAAQQHSSRGDATRKDLTTRAHTDDSADIESSTRHMPRDQVTIPLNVETKVIDAMQQNSKHLHSIEIRIQEARRVR